MSYIKKLSLKNYNDINKTKMDVFDITGINNLMMFKMLNSLNPYITYRKVYYEKNILVLLFFLDYKFKDVKDLSKRARKIENIINKIINLNEECTLELFNFNKDINPNNSYNCKMTNTDLFNLYILNGIDYLKDYIVSDFKNIKINRNMFLILFDLFSLREIITFLDLLKSKEIDMHNFINNINLINKKYYDDEDNKKIYSKELYNFLIRILNDYSIEKIDKCLNYINYKKVRNSKNWEEIELYIKYIERSKIGMNLVLENKEYPNHMKLGKYNKDDKIFTTKNQKIINNIGIQTNCCFRKNGAADSLLPVAIKSPISSIIVGKINNEKDTWFSFLWELVEYNEDTGLFDINLIFDNVESSSRLGTKYFIDNMNDIFYNKKYKKCYIGNLRNDIDSDFFNETHINNDNELKLINDTLKNRYRTLVNFEKNFNSYGYDDSKKIYTFIENNFHNEFILRKCNKGDLHRIKYIESFIYKENSDKEFLTIDVDETPNYIIDNDFNILGYLCTRYYYKEKNNYNSIYTIKDINKLFKKQTLIEDKKEFIDNYDKILYIEDLFLLKNRNIIYSLKYIEKDLIKFINENDIKFISASFNNNSKNFLKRIKTKVSYIEFIEDPRFSDNTIIKTNFNRNYIKNDFNIKVSL